MNINSNLAMPIKEFKELNPGDCFVWFEEWDLGSRILMKADTVEIDGDSMEYGYIDLTTGEVNFLSPDFSDSLVLEVKLTATATFEN